VSNLDRGQRLVIGGASAATVATGILTFTKANEVLTFVVAAVALAALAALVGQAIEQLSFKLSAAVTGILQAALGNLPELLVAVFALRAGLTKVVQAALVGSILANTLLVLGMAFTIGGLRHGRQRFDTVGPNVMATMMLLAVGALALPTLAHQLHTPASAHAEALSMACAVVLLLVFIASIPFSVSLHARPEGGAADETEEATWSTRFAVGVLAATSLAAAFVSEWFVRALEPAIATLHISQAFAGLVIVAVASNAVENMVGVQLAAKNKLDYAMSVILNSPLLVALGLFPLLVLVSPLIGSHHLTLVLPPLQVVALALTAVIAAFVVNDGESNWLEGLALMGLYGVIASAFWWG
jgi:Ca2+:H+ antiporter